MDELVGPGRVEGPVVLPAPVDLPVGQPVEGVDLGGVLEQRLEELDAPGKILNIIEDVVMRASLFLWCGAARRRVRRPRHIDARLLQHLKIGLILDLTPGFTEQVSFSQWQNS